MNFVFNTINIFLSYYPVFSISNPLHVLQTCHSNVFIFFSTLHTNPIFFDMPVRRDFEIEQKKNLFKT